MKYILIPLALIAVATFARLSFDTVDAAEYAYVTVLGEHRDTFDGGADGAGLQFGWPWPIQQVQRLDRRLQQFDLPLKDELTHDHKVLSIEAYVCWKIKDAGGAEQFVKRIGAVDRAQTILGPLIVGRLGAAISMRRMDDLVSMTIIDPVTSRTKVDSTVDELRSQLLSELAPHIELEYGIELVDIRLRRFSHPLKVSESIFARIRAERNQEAAKYFSEGEYEFTTRINKADAEVREKLAQARNDEERIKADTDIDSMKIRAAASSQDPQFYEFLKKMEKLQSIVGDSRTMLFLSTHRQMFDSLFNPPIPKANAPKDEKKGGK